MEGGNNTTKFFSDASSVVAKVIFFTKGKGLHKDYLTSFELALRDAAISDLNLVSVSSIMPPECKIVTREEGRKHLLPGQIAFTVMAKSATNEPNRLIAASIGLADRLIILSMDIYQSTIQLVKQLRRLAIMLRTWQWRCLLQ